ncbi:ornithine cyclodeaminase family protein [Streptomyces sp. NPDC096142]|uniref:ornithine cyclodeaminase family protein n=1 Tax=Streptomyces sp. NPDC096142 TaxID=3366077 RepID=UPI0037F4CB47
MYVVTEDRSSALIDHELAFRAVTEAFVAAATPGAALFPVVIGHGSDPDDQFTLKSGASGRFAGVKIGTYFPSNDARGLPRHGTTILLFDQESGRIGAAVEASQVNAYRTAAADAVATHALARAESSVLTVFGTGHQALYECLAVARIRPITRINVVGRDRTRADALRRRLDEHLDGVETRATDPETGCASADVIVTVTTARAPLFEADWVGPGTHVSAMGCDSPGKQELPPALCDRAALFCDLPSQSLRIGEFQHFGGEPEQVTAIGSVLARRAPGRTAADRITVFDSSGIALQDLYVAEALLARARVTDPDDATPAAPVGK